MDRIGGSFGETCTSSVRSIIRMWIFYSAEVREVDGGDCHSGIRIRGTKDSFSVIELGWFLKLRSQSHVLVRPVSRTACTGRDAWK